MIKKQIIYILLLPLIMPVIIKAQTNKPATNYLNVTGPIVFENKSFRLNWSSHPSVNFYKQEYLTIGEDVNKYKMMLMLDVIAGETTPKNVVSSKIAEIKKMKEGNPMVNYEIIQNPKTGEYLLDFLLTANAADGTTSIVERNVYRYKTFTDKAGNKGVLLFAVSSRAYAKDVNNFLIALKANRKVLVNEVAQYQMPEINIK
ncbi:MAG: hypothetical protein WKI04_04410 [Ferruginibacter sp.]